MAMKISSPFLYAPTKLQMFGCEQSRSTAISAAKSSSSSSILVFKNKQTKVVPNRKQTNKCRTRKAGRVWFVWLVEEKEVGSDTQSANEQNFGAKTAQIKSPAVCAERRTFVRFHDLHRNNTVGWKMARFVHAAVGTCGQMATKRERNLRTANRKWPTLDQ